MDYHIFSGNSNIPLSQTIASILGKKLSAVEIIRFADSESRVRILEDVSEKTVFIIQSLSNPVDNHLVEFLLMADAVKRGEAKKIIGVIPYYGYARQDRVHRPGECLSSQLISHVIETAGFDKIITVELHNDAILGFFSKPVVHVSGLTVFSPEVKKQKDDLVVVTPDAGALKRAQKFAEGLDIPLALIEKKRDLNSMHKIASMKVVGDVEGKTAIIVDDVIVTGGTLINAAYLLKQKGAKQVVAAVTHADFVGGSDKILKESPVDHIWVTDTIKINQEFMFPKLKIVPIAPVIAAAMKSMVK